MQTTCGSGITAIEVQGHELGRWLVAAVLTLLLAGCGGDGGGGVWGAAPTPFTSYGSIVYPSTVKMSGASQETTYTYDTVTGKFTTLNVPSGFTSGASITETWDAGHALTSETVTSYLGTTILTLNSANGDTLNQSVPTTPIVYGKSANSQNYLLKANHAVLTWDYQNFGVWLTGAGTLTGQLGAMTVGAETAGAAVLASGTYTFTGVSAGYYIDTAGAGHFVTSNMSAAVDFSVRSINFTTTGSAMTSNLSVAPTANNNLNLSGTLTYAAGSNQFTGSVATAGGGPLNAAMNGTTTGKFYGPSAQEIGGTFSVSNGTVGAGGAAYVGGFGGKR